MMNSCQTWHSLRPGGGECTSHRSTWVVPSARRLAASVARSRSARLDGSLVVRNTAPRSTPLSVSAWPTSASLPYIVAVSMCR